MRSMLMKTALATVIVLGLGGPAEAKFLFFGKTKPASPMPAAAALRAQVTKTRAGFEQARSSLLGSNANHATGVELETWAAAIKGPTVGVGVAKETKQGRSQFRLTAHLGVTTGAGAGVQVGSSNYDNRYPGNTAIPVTERRAEPFYEDLTASRIAFLVGGGHLEGAGWVRSRGWETTTISNYGGIGGGLTTGKETRHNFSIPISPHWKSAPLRRAERGMKLADRTLKAIDRGDLNKALILADSLEDLRLKGQ